MLMFTNGPQGGPQMDFLHRLGAYGAIVAIAQTAVVHAADDQSSTPTHADWQTKRLMTPTDSQLAAESKGQVFIYDSLDINQVEKAMDANFHRIQHMMFTRIYHPAPTPHTPAYLEDDGCD
jgi:hypothetical protein